MSGLTLSSVEVLWLAQVGGCNTGMSYVLWLAQVGGVRIGVCEILLNVQGGLLQKIIEDRWLYNFPRAIILHYPPFLSCLLGEVPL